MFCIYCGHDNDNSNKFCMKCGKSLSAAAANLNNGASADIKCCEHCGYENYKENTFCMKCGRPLSSSTTSKSNKDGIVCSTCGYTNANGKDLCLRCGEPLPKPSIKLHRLDIQIPQDVDKEMLYKRAFMYIEDDKRDEAFTYLEWLLDHNPEDARAYLGKFMLEVGLKFEEDIVNLKVDYTSNINYTRAYKYGDSEMKKRLDGYISQIKERKTKEEDARIEAIYQNSLTAMNKARSVDDYNKAKMQFDAIANYKDSKSMAEQCEQKMTETIYNDAVQYFYSANSENGFKNAGIKFTALGDYKDSKEKVKECEQKAQEWRKKAEIAKIDSIYTKAIAAMEKSVTTEEFGKVIDDFARIIDYKDSKEQIAKCKAKIEEISLAEYAYRKAVKRKRIIISIISVASVAAITAGVIIGINVPRSNKYNKAVELLEGKNYDEALNLFTELEDYKDSEDMVREVKYLMALDLFENGEYEAAIKTFETLGYYKDALKNAETASEKLKDEQNAITYKNAVKLYNDKNYKKAYDAFASLKGYKDADQYLEKKALRIAGAYVNGDSISFGKYDWYVISINDDDYTILCKESVCKRTYNKNNKSVTWKECSLRKWLNDDFYNDFDDDEKSMIKKTSCKNKENTEYETTGGDDTKDHVYLLDIDEDKFLLRLTF